MEPCTPGRCRHFGDGHVTHPIRARRTGETPWGWRDGVVTAASGGVATLRYVVEDAEVTVRHHAVLPLAAGDPVRLHEEFRMLGCPSGWFCVDVTGGLGPVVAPVHPELGARESSPGVVDLATGNALATDHMTRGRPPES